MAEPAKKREANRAFIGLGSNEGDRLGYVQQAMQLLKDDPGIEVVECSSLYETEAIIASHPSWYVNAVAAIETDLTPKELLSVCKEIEDRLTGLHGGRTKIVDLDILFFSDQIIDTTYLKVPHPSLHKRAYALVPLLEVSPDFIHPAFNKTVSELHEELPEPELVYLYGTRGMDF